MPIVEFLTKKNEIFFKETGLILIPKDQIVDMVPMPLSTNSPIEACPYCMEYNYTYLKCAGCPMNKADNNCREMEGNSTFELVMNIMLKKKNTTFMNPALIKLVDEYNESHGFYTTQTSKYRQKRVRKAEAEYIAKYLDYIL